MKIQFPKITIFVRLQILAIYEFRPCTTVYQNLTFYKISF